MITTASAIGSPWGFTARQFDAEVGLYHFRARAYSPELKRFIQRDPLEYVDGPNPYSYVRAAPVRRLDPMGTDDKDDKHMQEGVKNVVKILNDAGQSGTGGEVAGNEGDASGGAVEGGTAQTSAFGHVTFDTLAYGGTKLCPCADEWLFLQFMDDAIHENEHVKGESGDAEGHMKVHATVAAIFTALYIYADDYIIFCPCGCGSPWANARALFGQQASHNRAMSFDFGDEYTW